MVFKIIITAAAFVLLAMLATAAKAQAVYPLQVVCLPSEIFIKQMDEEGWNIYAYGEDSRDNEDAAFYIWTRGQSEMFFVIDYYTMGIVCFIAHSDNFEKFDKRNFGKEAPA